MLTFLILHIPVFMIAVVAFVYAQVLTEPGHLLSGVYKFLEKKITSEFIFKPIIGCYRCVAGQMAFWAFAYLLRNDFVTICNFIAPTDIIFLTAKAVFVHFYFTCLTILTVCLINKVYH